MTDATTPHDPASQEAILRSEILKDAERKANRVRERGEREAKKRLDEVRAEAERRRDARLLAARQEAEGRERAILASIEQEKKRRWLMLREGFIHDVLEQAKAWADTLDGEAREQSLATLFGEALDALGESAVGVRCLPEDRDAVLAIARRRKVRATVECDADIGGGVIVEDAPGRKRCDNTHATRLLRMENILRRLATPPSLKAVRP